MALTGAAVAVALSAAACSHQLPEVTPNERPFFDQFAAGVSAYMSLREKASASVPALSDEASPEQIEQHERALAAAILSARQGIDRGNVFSDTVASGLRARIARAFEADADVADEVEEEIEDFLELEPWPETTPGPNTVAIGASAPAELVEWLPALPRALHYMFVRRDLILIDEEAQIVVDVLPAALPEDVPITVEVERAVIPSVPAFTPPISPPADAEVRFAVVGDSGAGSLFFGQRGPQYEVAELMERYREQFAFDLVVMLGDNLYGRESAADYRFKFEEPFDAQLKAGVEFRASLGNHDDIDQIHYEHFNMHGRRYYSFDKGPVRFVALDTPAIYDENEPPDEQLGFLDKTLSEPGPSWRIVFFHHPVFSSGRKHGGESTLARMKPFHERFARHGVDVVLAGHEHFYERIEPQDDVLYFISGAASKLRRGNISPKRYSAVGYDQDYSFMLMAVEGSVLYYQSVALSGRIIDCGVVRKNDAPEPAAWLDHCARQTEWMRGGT